MFDILKLGDQLIDKGKEGVNGLLFDVQSIPGEVDVLQISLENQMELPIFISAAGNEILCMSYLFKETEIKEDTKSEMHNAMLTMNIPMPLSSFGKIEEQYVVFGALSILSSLEDIVQEIITLSDNSLEALEAMKDYLK